MFISAPWLVLSNVKKIGRRFSNLMAFSEYLNFTEVSKKGNPLAQNYMLGKKSGAINCRIFAFISRKQYVTSMWSSVRK